MPCVFESMSDTTHWHPSASQSPQHHTKPFHRLWGMSWHGSGGPHLSGSTGSSGVSQPRSPAGTAACWRWPRRCAGSSGGGGAARDRRWHWHPAGTRSSLRTQSKGCPAAAQPHTQHTSHNHTMAWKGPQGLGISSPVPWPRPGSSKPHPAWLWSPEHGCYPHLRQHLPMSGHPTAKNKPPHKKVVLKAR